MATRILKGNLMSALYIAQRYLEQNNPYKDVNGKSGFHVGIDKVIEDLEKGEQLQVVED